MSFFHSPESFLSLKASIKETIANKRLVVNNLALSLFGILAVADMIKAAPNQPADKLINKSEIIVKISGSIFVTKKI